MSSICDHYAEKALAVAKAWDGLNDAELIAVLLIELEVYEPEETLAEAKELMKCQSVIPWR